MKLHTVLLVLCKDGRNNFEAFLGEVCAFCEIDGAEAEEVGGEARRKQAHANTYYEGSVLLTVA